MTHSVCSVQRKNQWENINENPNWQKQKKNKTRDENTNKVWGWQAREENKNIILNITKKKGFNYIL